MNMRLRSLLPAVLCLWLLLTAASVAGCSTDPSIDDATTSTPTSAAITSTTQSVSTSVSPPMTLSPYDRELADTAAVQNDLARHLTEQDVAQNDPRVAVIFGLRARVQALSCRKALAEGDLDLARQAMREVYSTLNRGRAVAEGSVADMLAEAHAVIETLGDPSGDPESAAELLDEFIDTLEPLLDQAEEMAADSTP